MASSRETRILRGDEPLRPSMQRFRLVVLRGPEPGAVYELAGPETKLGKGEDNDVVIPDATVSRAHLVIVQTGDLFTLKDLGSTNGTFLEEQKIKDAARSGNSITLEFGRSSYLGGENLIYMIVDGKTLILDEATGRNIYEVMDALGGYLGYDRK